MTELMKENLLALTGYNPLNNRFNYNIGDLPFIDYLLEDKSKYPFINTVINPNTGKNYIDEDNDFLLGDSGGILMNINFVFVNTEIFSRTAQFFTKHNKYTLEPEDTPAYDRFWKIEMDRRIRGVKAKCKLYIKDIPAYLSAKTDAERKALLHYVRITGDHYTYLNYGRIERVPNEEERKQLDRQGLIKVETIDGFPRFWDGDYWNFKIDEFIGNNKFNLCKAKARRKGFSYKRGSQAANTLNSTKNVTVTLAADIMDYLTDKGATSQMVKTNLDWFENNTNWARGYLSENFEKGIELGYKKSKDGQKAYGFRSKLLSVAIGKNESAAIGKKAIETDFEEAGKCFGAGTTFIKNDGTTEFVENLKIGDILLGPDSKPRTIIGLTTGEDELYEITPLNGETQIVNSKHPIYMIHRNSYKNICEPITMTAPEYIDMINKHPRWKENYSLIKTDVEFKKQDVKIEPYIFGLWIGDGAKDDSYITNEDSEVIDYLYKYASNNNLKITIKDNIGCKAKDYRFTRVEGETRNWFISELNNLGVLNNKFIPQQYISTDRQSRLEFLAGIIDSDGTYDKRKHNFEIIQKDISLAYDICYIARSLGLKSTISEKIIKGVTYYRILILSGCHLIPTKIKRKQAEDYIPLQKNQLETRFNIKHIGRGTYYGFEVDNDNLVLHKDFTIVHNCPNLQKALDVMLSNSESGAIQVGTIRVYGTGGTKGANWEAFRLCYYNPAKNNMLPMENIWDDNARHTTCGFFFPQIWDYEPFIEDGNSLIFSAYNHDKQLKDKARKDKDSSEYVIYVGQRANRPSEAFVNTTENIFYSPELNSHIVKLQNDREYQFYTDGWYVLEDGIVKFLNKEQCIQNGIFKGKQFHEYIKDVPHNNRTDVHGCVREYYPYIPNNGDLYFIACDTYRVNKLGKDVTDKNSLYSFQVYMRSNTKYPHMSKRLVASYCGRLNSMEENDKLLLYACLRWNAKVLIEAGTGETIPNFKKWGYRNRLLKDPSYYLNRSMSLSNTNDYGVVIGDGDKKLEGLSMLRDFLYEVVGYTENGTPIYQFQNIYDVSYLLECERFVYDKNWDRISTGIVAMFEFKKDSILLQRSVTETQKHNTNFAERITL